KDKYFTQSLYDLVSFIFIILYIYIYIYIFIYFYVVKKMTYINELERRLKIKFMYEKILWYN
ncbi:MAG: hypothetical protein N7Q72_07280, partial [Spiroplasma sp. Tabriz.8]|nr:hypothetical protein [Spiroplasma sp. Tabriz.8]